MTKGIRVGFKITYRFLFAQCKRVLPRIDIAGMFIAVPQPAGFGRIVPQGLVIPQWRCVSGVL